MATPKILPPRPTRSTIPRPASSSAYSLVTPRAPQPPRPAKAAIQIAPAPKPQAPVSQPVAKITLSRKPPPPVASMRTELRSQDFEEVLEAIEAIEDVTDPIDVLFDAMEALFSVETSVEAGAICLASLMKAIPCRGGIVHLYDAESREFVAVFALGPRAEHLVLTRAPEADPLISAALRKHHPIVVSYLGAAAPRPLDRHAMLDAAYSVLVCPIVDGARFLGAIELVDPRGAVAFDEAAEHGAAYVADRYAGFLAENGVELANVVAPPSGFIS